MPEPAPPQLNLKRINGWSKRATPQQRQTNDFIDAKFSNSLVRPVYLVRRAPNTGTTQGSTSLI